MPSSESRQVGSPSKIGGGEADDDARQADGVGDDLVVEVDEGDDDQRGKEGEGQQRTAATEAEAASAGDGGEPASSSTSG